MLRLALALFLAQIGFHGFLASLPLAMLAAGRSDAEIGAIMGSAAIMTLVAAFVAGGLIDRFGGRLVFLAGVATYALGAAALATGVVTAGSPDAEMVAVRLLQGAGIATCLPAALSLVPGLVDSSRIGTGLAVVGAAANLSIAAAPPLSLAVLERSSLAVVAAIVLACAVAATIAVWTVRERQRAPRPSPGRLRTFRPAWRGSWFVPLVITFLFVAHWGVITGFLPQRAAVAGADVGLFFTADAVALLVLRVPAGYLADRVGSIWLIVAGIAITSAALALLLVPATTPLLILSGIGSGVGAALFLPPVTLELSRRSDDADRGSAYALFSVAFAAAIALGSIGAAPLVARLGFEPALAGGIALALLAAVAAGFDRSLRAASSAAARGMPGASA